MLNQQVKERIFKGIYARGNMENECKLFQIAHLKQQCATKSPGSCYNSYSEPVGLA